MWCPGRGNSGGSWLPEEKKANMWHRRGNSGGSWPPAFPRLYNGTSEMGLSQDNMVLTAQSKWLIIDPSY